MLIRTRLENGCISLIFVFISSGPGSPVVCIFFSHGMYISSQSPFSCPTRQTAALQMVHTYSSKLLAECPSQLGLDLWHSMAGLGAHHYPGKQHLWPRSRMRPAPSQSKAILGQGGSHAGEVRLGREEGRFSAHDYSSQACWVPPKAHAATRENTPTTELATEAQTKHAWVWDCRS